MPVWKLFAQRVGQLDLSNPDELLRYAKKLIGHSFREVLMLGISPDDSSMKDYGNVKFKGGMGTLIESATLVTRRIALSTLIFRCRRRAEGCLLRRQRTENCLLETAFHHYYTIRRTH